MRDEDQAIGRAIESMNDECRTFGLEVLLGELDNLAPVDGFPADLEAALVNSDTRTTVIESGTHLYFMQPTGADGPGDPRTDLTRFEQQGIAIELTLNWLDEVLAPD